MFLFSIGITKGKWGTLLTNLLAFKPAYNRIRPLADVLPEIAAQYPDRYRNVRLHDLGDELFEYYARIVRATHLTLPTKGCPMRI